MKKINLFENKKIKFVIFVIFFVTFNFLLFENMNLLLDSDMSSELILSKMMADEGSLISKNWHYSTELRVLNTQLIFAPLFYLFNNYQIVRIVGVIILDAIMLWSLYYFQKNANGKLFIFLAIIFVGSYSKDYFDFFIKAPHYLPYLIVNFLSYGLLIDIYNKKDRLKIKRIIFYILALLSSMNGIRQLSVLYLPLICTLILFVFIDWLKKRKLSLKEEKEIIKVICLGFIFSLVGYLFSTKILSNYYSISSEQWSLNIELANIKKIKEIVYSWLVNFGYIPMYSAILKYLTLGLAILFIVMYLYCSVSILRISEKYNKVDIFLVVYVFIGMLVTTSIFMFTSMRVVTRYFSLNALMAFVIFSIYLKNNLTFRNKIVTLFAVLLIISLSFIVLFKEVENSNNQSLIKIVDILQENEIQEGYASFWNGNVLTEISNGYLETWQFDLELVDKVDSDDDLIMRSWLQKKTHFEDKPKTPFFILLETDEIVKFNFNNKIDDKMEYHSDRYTLYIFDSYEELNGYLK